MPKYTLVKQVRPKFGVKPLPYTFTVPNDELAFGIVSNEINLVLVNGTFNVQEFYDAGGEKLLRDGVRIFPTRKDTECSRGEENAKRPRVQLVVVGEESGAAK